MNQSILTYYNLSQYNQPSECSWVQLQHDAGAFEAFFRSRAPGLCAYVYKIVKDKPAAEDIVQDFFSRLWQKRAEIIITGTPDSYAYRAVHNAALNFLRDNKVVTGEIPEVVEMEDSVLEQELIHQRRVAQLQAVIARLPEQCRIIVEKVCLERRKYKDVAEELGISVFTVRNQVGKAYEILRNNIFLELICLLLAGLLK